MAVYKINPEKDATIYSLFPYMNTGLDEIIEATTTTFPSWDEEGNAFPQVSRALIKFDNDDINKVVDDVIGNWDNVGDVRLKLRLATAEGLNTDTRIDVFPISGSWNMGTGRYLDNPLTTNGCSWQWSDYSGSKRWPIIVSPEDSLYVTASMDPLGAGGGATWWYKDPQNPAGLVITSSQVIGYKRDNDLNVPVTNAVERFYSSSKGYVLDDNGKQMVNEGFLVKQSAADEFINIADKAAELKYFSADTNTIYPPELEFRWDDSNVDSTLPIISQSSFLLSLNDNPGTFRLDSIHSFRLNISPKFPERVYQTSSLYLSSYRLPVNSYYAIKDLDTNEFIIDFSKDYTKISADNDGSYFRIYMNGLQPERYYQLLIKTELNGDTIILDNNYYFKVING